MDENREAIALKKQIISYAQAWVKELDVGKVQKSEANAPFSLYRNGNQLST